MDDVTVRKADGPELRGIFVRTHIRDHKNAARGAADFLTRQAREEGISLEGDLVAMQDPGRIEELTEMIDRLYILMLTYFCDLPEPDVNRIDDMAHRFITPELERLLRDTRKEAYIVTMIDDGCMARIRRLTDIDAVLEGQENRGFLAKHHFTEFIIRSTTFTDGQHNTLMRLSDLDGAGGLQ